MAVSHCTDCGISTTNHSQRCKPCAGLVRRKLVKKKPTKQKQKKSGKCTGCGVLVWRGTALCKACHVIKFKPLPADCKGCGKRFQPDRKGAKYCSRECAFKHVKDWLRPVPERKLLRQCLVYFRHCSVCSLAFVARRANSVTCSKQCAYSNSKTYYQPRLPTHRQCVTCDTWFEGKNPRKYCSPECRVLVRKYSGSQWTRKKYGVSTREWQRVRLMVFKRDEYICHLCALPTNPSADCNDDMYPNADHVVPVAAGGLTVIENLRCAHRHCNMAKGVVCDTPALVERRSMVPDVESNEVEGVSEWLLEWSQEKAATGGG